MNRPPAASFPARLDLARRMVARGPLGLPVDVADQLGAADREVRQIHGRLVTVLPMLEPERHWRQRVDVEPSDDVRAYLLAATMGCTIVCVHLRRGGPQPAIARLPLRRVDCQRCVQTLYRPPADEDDRCDVCGGRGVVIFHPFSVRLAPVMLAGDACPACASVLRIVQEVAS